MTIPTLGHPPLSPLAIKFARFPEELKQRKQWAMSGPDKRPLQPNGVPASSTDPETWWPFEDIVMAAEARGFDIGFMLSSADDYACIDQDVKIDSPAEVLQRQDSICRVFETYTERSRGGHGTHTWLRAANRPGRKRDGVEVYTQARYIVCTGDVIYDLPIADREELLTTMMSQMFEFREGQNAIELVELPPEHDDWFIMQQAFEAANADKFIALFDGKWRELGYGSQSEADMAHLAQLCFLTPSNEQVRRIFRKSELGKREKATKDNRYLDLTIAKIRSRMWEELSTGRELARMIMERPPEYFVEGGLSVALTLRTHSTFNLKIETDYDFDNEPPARHLIKGILPEKGIGAIYGASGSFKSFAALDILHHVANGMEYYGRKTMRKPSVLIAFEGQAGIPNRLKAMRQAETKRRDPSAFHVGEPAHDVRTNISVIRTPIDIQNQQHRDELVAQLQAKGLTGGILCIDTLAQASAGVEENSSAMGAILENLKELQYRLDCLIIVIHHTGKDAERGMRGWSGLFAAMDFVLECIRTAKTSKGKLIVRKQKDGADGLSFNFETVLHIVGEDEDGEHITSLAIEHLEGDSYTSAETKRIPSLGTIDAETSEADERFVHAWAMRRFQAGEYPSKNSLKGQLAEMKNEYGITQDRIIAAANRLIAKSLFIQPEDKSPNGNVWLMPQPYPE